MTPKPLLIILVALLLVAPALAGDYELTANINLLSEHTVTNGVSSFAYDGTPEGKGIQRINFDIPTGTVVNFTLTYGDGDTVDGWATYTNDGFFAQRSEVALNGVASVYTSSILSGPASLEEVGRVDIVNYARNKTSATTSERGIVIYSTIFSAVGTEDNMVFYKVTGGNDGVIYKVTFTSNQPINSITVYTDSRQNLSNTVSKNLLDVVNEWVALAVQLGIFVYETVLTLLYWLKFFFWDNLMMTVALYIAITAAVAFNKTKDVFKGIQQFFKYQRSLFEFILILWSYLVNLIATFRGIFRI